MFSDPFGLKWARETPPSTCGRLIYAIGDIHGRLDALNLLLRDIAQDASITRPAQRPLLVFLGDYVDRGAESRQVVEMVLRIQAHGTYEVAALKGNHEQALLQFLAEPDFAMTWMEHGGRSTLKSYGVSASAARGNTRAWSTVRDEFRRALPEAHLRFYRELDLVRVIGDYAFVHAGVRPGVPLAEQTERDLLWIRDDFLKDRGPFDKVIVHGHTPSEVPQMLKHRLGVDTGAYATGVLTAVRLYGVEQRLIQAKVQRQAA